MLRLLVTTFALAAPVSVAAQTAAPDAVPAVPVEHRLTPDEIAAAQADGAERNRAAELLAMTRGTADLALPLEKPKRTVHGEAGVGFGSNGAREVFGSATTDLGNGASATVAGDYTQFGRQRYRPF